MKKIRILFGAIIISLSCTAQENEFEFSEDIGNPKIVGSSSFVADNSYKISGSGYNIWFERDELHYLFNEMKGDFKLTATFEFVGEGVDPHRKIGWMLRESRDDDASHISAVLHGDGLTVLQWRVKKGMEMRDPEDEIFAKKSHYNVIQMERKGNLIMMRGAINDGELKEIGSHEMANFSESILAGLYMCSHNPDVLETAIITNVVIEN